MFAKVKQRQMSIGPEYTRLQTDEKSSFEPMVADSTDTRIRHSAFMG